MKPVTKWGKASCCNHQQDMQKTGKAIRLPTMLILYHDHLGPFCSILFSYFVKFPSIWVFPKIVIPQNGWFIMENPIKIDDLGGPKPLFLVQHPYLLPALNQTSHSNAVNIITAIDQRRAEAKPCSKLL